MRGRDELSIILHEVATSNHQPTPSTSQPLGSRPFPPHTIPFSDGVCEWHERSPGRFLIVLSPHEAAAEHTGHILDAPACVTVNTQGMFRATINAIRIRTDGGWWMVDVAAIMDSS